MSARRPFALAVAAAAALPSLIVAQGDVDTGGFVVCLGSDTLAVERYTRSRTTLKSEIVLRSPAARLVSYTAALDTLGNVESFELTLEPLGPSTPARMVSRGTVSFRGDTADVSLTLGESTRVIKVAARPGSIPLAAFSHALVEQAILQAQRSGRDSFEFDWVGVGASKAYPTYVTRRPDGSVRVGFFDAPAVVTLDGRGRMLSLDGRATTAKVEVRRVDEPDLEHFASAFVAAEIAWGPTGQLSPRDTVHATIGAAHLMVDYGRPHKRGRAIFGHVVPWNRVWRTGANAATQLITDSPITMRGRTIPAGRYSLWTLPMERGATLIVNGRSGQWGTEYEANMDLAHVDLTPEALSTPIEQFTIAIEPAGRSDAGVLRLTWDSTSYSVPFTVARP
jgi:hypothetical protein